MTKAAHKDLVAQILDLPQAPVLVEELRRVLEQEQEKRREFYASLFVEEQKAEFINGEIVIQSPVKKHHNEYSGLLYQFLNVYAARHDLGFVGVEKIMISLTRNDYEPDLCYFRKELAGQFTENQSFFPAPDLIVEIVSSKTESRDRGIKFDDYQNHGIEEYWMILPDQKVVEQYHLHNGVYELILKSSNGEIESFAVKGFKIPIQAIFDKAVNLNVLAKLLA